jgi:two-component system, cell cycle response regulator
MVAAKTRGSREVFALLFEVTRRLNEGEKLEAVLETISAAACRLAGARDASVMLLDEARERLLCRASHGLEAAEAERASFRVGEGIAGWVAATGEPLRSDDAAKDARFAVLDDQVRTIRSLCCVPLTGRDGVFGALTVSSAEPACFDEEDEEVLRFLAASVVKDIENARLYRLAVTDPLTGAYNRQYLSEHLPGEIERCRRYAAPLSLALADVDHFKRVNDTLGHRVGDQVLRALVERCKRSVRDIDSVIRYGGEEILLLLPQTDARGALHVAERMREAVVSEPIVVDSHALAITMSVGVAELAPQDETPDQLIARADAALYAAKAGGRNRVELSGTA